MSGEVDMKLEVDVIPVSDVDRAKGILRALGLEARRRRCADGWASDRPVHSSELRGLDHLRTGTHHGRARFGRTRQLLPWMSSDGL
jgi:hypothetical protein